MGSAHCCSEEVKGAITTDQELQLVKPSSVMEDRSKRWYLASKMATQGTEVTQREAEVANRVRRRIEQTARELGEHTQS